MINKINIHSKKHILIVYVALILVTLVVYWQVNQYDFVNIDDNIYVTKNINIQSGITLGGIRWAFTTIHSELWNPLSLLSYMLDYHFYGLNAGGYHVTNLILHILSTLLLFWLFNRMTGAIWESAFVAAIFAIHPMHVESVAWISERRDVLSAFFWMLTLCFYVYYTEKPNVKRYLLVLFYFVCALMSKSMVVTLPVVMILLDYWPLKRFELQKGNVLLWQVKEKTPFFVLSAVFSILTIYAHRNRPIEHFPLSSCLANASVSFMTYLYKTFLPHGMNVFYPFPQQIPVWQISVATILIILISFFIIVTARRLPYLFVGWLWFAITILPVIGIIQDTDQAMADRYHYLPSIGISIILAWGIPLLFLHKNMRKKILLPAGIAVLAIMSILAWQQCGYWKNSLELCKHTLQVTTNNHVAHNCLAHALFEEGKLEEAIEHANEAIRLNPNHDKPYEDRAVFYFKLGHYQRAIEDINKAVRLNPDDAFRYYLRGNMLKNLRQYQRAINDYNEAIRLKQDYAEAYNERGGTYFNIGQHQRAINDYKEAIRLKQDYAEAYNNRAFVYINQGREEIGCNDAKKACELGNCRILDGARIRVLCR